MRYCTSPAKAAPSPTQPLRLHGRDPLYIALKVSATSMLPPPERTGHSRASLTVASRLSALIRATYPSGPTRCYVPPRPAPCRHRDTTVDNSASFPPPLDH